MHLVALHLAQQLVDLLRLGNELGRPEERPDRDVRLAPGQAPEEVFHVQDADDLIGRALVDRDPRVAGAHHALQHLLRRRVHVDRDDVGPRDHHLVDLLVPEREDGMDHVALLDIEHALLLARLDERLDVLFADERALLRVGPEGRGHDAGEEEQHRDDDRGPELRLIGHRVGDVRRDHR